LLLYAGEFQPRKPVDGDVHVFDLNNAVQQSVAENAGLWRTLSASLKPEPRVGATTVFDAGNLYMWGGRGGVDMMPLDPKQSGIWKGQILQNEVIWEKLEGTGDEPVTRSFHASVMANVSVRKCSLHPERSIILFLDVVIVLIGICIRENYTSMRVVLPLVASRLFILMICNPLGGLSVQMLQILPVAELLSPL
jgi:hypothetical protein